jgi:hypothetical protein
MKLLLTGVKSAIDAECVGASRPSRRRRLDARRGFAGLSHRAGRRLAFASPVRRVGVIPPFWGHVVKTLDSVAKVERQFGFAEKAWENLIWRRMVDWIG